MKALPLSVFYCYSHEDEPLRKELQKHLRPLELEGLIKNWSDREIIPGENWKAAISRALAEADIILPLVSASFMNSEYCQTIEMKRAMDRHRANDAVVIPVLLRPVSYQGQGFADLQGLPANALAVTSWPNQDEALVSVAAGIRKAVERISGANGSQPRISKPIYTPVKPNWMWPAIALTGLLAAALAIFIYLRPEKSPSLPQNSSPDAPVEVSPANNGTVVHKAPVETATKVPPKTYEVTVTVDSGATDPVFFLGRSRVLPLSFDGNHAIFRVTSGSHEMTAKYTNPNKICTAILTAPAKEPVIAKCNID